MKKLLLACAFALGLGSVAIAQGTGFFPFWPLVGGASYSCGSVNGVSNCTVPAGPTIVTGNETIPANTTLSSGAAVPQNVLVSLKSLNGLPLLFQNATTSHHVSASNISGGVVFNNTHTITQANVTLPAAPVDGQQYAISTNRTITALSVSAGGSTAIAANTSPTALTASTTIVQGYRFVYNLSGNLWYRLQ